MELPIFRELESAWFRSRANDVAAGTSVHRNGILSNQPSVEEPAPTGQPGTAVPAESSTAEADSPELETTATPEVSWQSAADQGWQPAAAEEESWQTAADRGWQAAQAASDPEVVALTEAGLPKRVPMAQLVPGGVEKATTNANRRSPEQVRGLLSAYHRGVQRGRTRNDGDEAKAPDSSTSTGHPHGGKEQEA
jgi:hypothetical protein